MNEPSRVSLEPAPRRNQSMPLCIECQGVITLNKCIAAIAGAGRSAGEQLSRGLVAGEQLGPVRL